MFCLQYMISSDLIFSMDIRISIKLKKCVFVCPSIAGVPILQESPLCQQWEPVHPNITIICKYSRMVSSSVIVEYLSILLISFIFCLPGLRLAWQIFRTRTVVNLFNYSLATCLAVAGKEKGKKVKQIKPTKYIERGVSENISRNKW